MVFSWVLSSGLERLPHPCLQHPQMLRTLLPLLISYVTVKSVPFWFLTVYLETVFSLKVGTSLSSQCGKFHMVCFHPLCRKFSFFSPKTHVLQCGEIILNRNDCDFLPSIFCFLFLKLMLFEYWIFCTGLLIVHLFSLPGSIRLYLFALLSGHFSQLSLPTCWDLSSKIY